MATPGLVRDAIRRWLGGDEQRRLLLLDECDEFFDTDAITGFTQRNRRRAPGQLPR